MKKKYQRDVKKYKQNILNGVFDFWYSSLKLLFYSNENSINTHLSAREKCRILNLARKCSGYVYVEIGSYLGASACFIAAGIKKSLKGKLYCIDTWKNEAMTECVRDTFAEFKANTAKYENIIVPMRGDSRDLAKSFNKRIDFLFIDGDHSYESVRMDVDAWFPKLNSGALVLFHDIGWAKGVQQVIDEIVRPVVKSEDRLPNLYWAWL